jgi:polysaccharide deacetylase family protein (PEP-CTERM system associated)
MNNILTFDVEDWYHPHLFPKDVAEQGRLESRVEEPTRKILKLLSGTRNRATFFVLGCIAEQHPDLVKRIQSEGHEVASHGYNHRMVYRLNRAEFVLDLVRSKSALEGILGEPVVGYRAPSWSLNEQTGWVFQELLRYGFRYDSSHFPFETFLYGSNLSPRFLHRLEPEPGRFIFELPPSVVQIPGMRIPFCGGFYFRLLPYRLIRLAVRWMNRREGEPALLYLHPWELDPEQPRMLENPRDRFIQYHNLKSAEKKLERLLNDFRFVSIRQHLREKEWLD